MSRHLCLPNSKGKVLKIEPEELFIYLIILTFLF